MTEAELQNAVTGLCKLFGIAWFHPYYSKRSVPGWPDLVLCSRRSLLFRELKTAKGPVTPYQREWGRRLSLAGQDWDIWRPADLASGRIQTELTAIR